MATHTSQLLLFISNILLFTGCFGSTPPQEEVSGEAQESPARQARAELKALRAQIQAGPPDLRHAGGRLAVDDTSTRAATELVLEMHRSISLAPLVVDDGVAASAPSLAARVRDLRAALQEHHGLLSDLSIVPLPPAPDAAVLEGAPDPAMVEAAITVEEATGGRWPLKRIFVAYALELEAIQEEAAALAACTEACPAGVAEHALQVQREAERLAALLEAFAALYC